MWAKTNPKIISDNLPMSLPICKLKKDLVKQVLWDVNGYRHFEFINSDMKTDVQSTKFNHCQYRYQWYWFSNVKLMLKPIYIILEWWQQHGSINQSIMNLTHKKDYTDENVKHWKSEKHAKNPPNLILK